MIPFNRTLPYDKIQGDLYIAQCPYCSASQVLLTMKPAELEYIRGGTKKLLVFPCCHEKLTIVDADDDYLLANRTIRR